MIIEVEYNYSYYGQSSIENYAKETVFVNKYITEKTLFDTLEKEGLTHGKKHKDSEYRKNFKVTKIINSDGEKHKSDKELKIELLINIWEKQAVLKDFKGARNCLEAMNGQIDNAISRTLYDCIKQLRETIGSVDIIEEETVKSDKKVLMMELIEKWEEQVDTEYDNANRELNEMAAMVHTMTAQLFESCLNELKKVLADGFGFGDLV